MRAFLAFCLLLPFLLSGIQSLAWGQSPAIVDQQQLIADTDAQGYISGRSTWLPYSEYAQTFRVGVTGTLAGVELMLNDFAGTTTEPLEVDIRPTNWQNSPVSRPYALVTREIWSRLISDRQPEMLYVDFGDDAPLVQKGDLLAVTLRTRDPNGYRWKSAKFDPYPDGQLFSSQGGIFWALSQWDGQQSDATFRTYVIPSVPEPSTIAILAAGGVAIRRRRR